MDSILSRRGSELYLGGKPFRAVGVNKYDLSVQFVQGGRERDKAIQAINEAADQGFSVIRFTPSGFFPAHLWPWGSADYWGRMDEVFSTAQTAGIRLLPCLVGQSYLFADLAGEAVRDQIVDRDSRARQYIDLYISQFVNRYRDHEALLCWELWCELNLGADLEFSRPYGYEDPLSHAPEMGTAPIRIRRDNYTTEQYIPLIRELAEMVRRIDPAHLIASGHSIPRHAAQHLRLTVGDMTEDSLDEAETYITDTHPDPIDIITIHLYPFFSDHLRFGITDSDSASVLRLLKQICDRIGKPAILEETGGQAFDDPTGTVPAFSRSVLEEAVAADYPAILWWMSSLGSVEDVLRFELDKTPELNRLLMEALDKLRKQAEAQPTLTSWSEK